MRSVPIASIEYPYRLVILRGKISKETNKSELVVDLP